MGLGISCAYPTSKNVLAELCRLKNGDIVMSITVFLKTDFVEIFNIDSLDFFPTISDNSVNLIVTSPPFSLLRKKEYGNANAENYLDWFRPLASEFKRTLREDGSLVIDIGGSWNKGLPTKNLYQFKLLIMLCEEMGFHLAQDFYWWNPSKLPSPSQCPTTEVAGL